MLSFHFKKIHFVYLLCIHACVQVCHKAGAEVRGQVLGVSSLYHVSSEYCTQFIQLSRGQQFHSLSHLASPLTAVHLGTSIKKSWGLTKIHREEERKKNINRNVSEQEWGHTNTPLAPPHPARGWECAILFCLGVEHTVKLKPVSKECLSTNLRKLLMAWSRMSLRFHQSLVLMAEALWGGGGTYWEEAG